MVFQYRLQQSAIGFAAQADEHSKVARMKLSLMAVFCESGGGSMLSSGKDCKTVCAMINCHDLALQKGSYGNSNVKMETKAVSMLMLFNAGAWLPCPLQQS